MGTSIHAFLEYDVTLRLDPSATDTSPFSTVPEAIDLTHFTLLRSGKDYRLIGALSGIRGPAGRSPLYVPRGLPSPMSSEAARCFDELYDPDYPMLGWLTLNEIGAAVAHMEFAYSDLSLEANLVLEMMRFLEQHLGPNRVRLVFGIE